MAALAASTAIIAIAATPALAAGGGGGGTAPPHAGAPAVSLSPSTVAFGAQDVGTTSTQRTITLTNAGSAALLINGMRQSGLDPLDFAEIDDQCVGLSIAAGGSCTLTVVFKPTATGTRTATISVTDSAASSPQVITFTGTGTSATGPTPISVDTAALSCTAGVCDLGSNALVSDFFFASVTAVGDTAPPFTWSLAAGALPPGVTLLADGSMYGTATAIGAYLFTLRVTDPSAKTATQAFRVTILPLPAAGDPRCQRAPSTSNAALSGPAIAGKVHPPRRPA
jgi:hypothetical protein